jgi:hypothetical protein
VSTARVSDNDVVTQGSGSADGILLDIPLIAMLIDGCQIIGNRITGVGGIGIEIRTPLASAMIKQNTIEGAGAGGIIMTGKASAQHLSIANNQLLGLVPTVGQLQSALGIRLDFVTAAEIEGNVIRDLGMDAKSNVTRVAVALVACSSARVAGNQISNLGTSAATFAPSAPSAAIAVTGPSFNRAEVSNNVIHRSTPVGPSTGDFTLWRAVYIGPLVQFAAAFNHSVVETAPGNFVVAGDNVMAAVILGEQVAAMRGNMMAAGAAGPFAPAGSFVEMTVTGSGIFTDNQCILLVPPDMRPSPLATLSAPIVAAANNVLTGGAPSLQIEVPKNTYTVTGNLTTEPILVNNQNLPAVWAPLNVTV